MADFCSKWPVLVHYKVLEGWHLQILNSPIYLYTLFVTQNLPPGPFKKLFWLFSHSRPLGERTIAAVETTNGWISMDIGWIWLGYIQDVLLVPFGPSVLPSGGPGGLEMALKCHKQAFLAVGGSGGSNLLDLSGS